MSAFGRLAELIRREIDSRGALPFARFMELALYAPELGYYERAEAPIGRRGDFYTSVSVGSLFGELLAFHFAGQCPRDGNPLQLVEAGAHDGRLAADLLGWMRRWRPEVFEALEYWIVEPSARRRAWQEQTLAGFAPRVRWTESPLRLPHSAFRIVFCNELLDAFPVRRLGWDAAAKRWFEWGVGWDGSRFVWRRAAGLPPPEPSAVHFPPPALQEVLPDGYIIEVSPAAEQWWREAASSLAQGTLLCFDYGLTEDELFVPERTGGTLRACFQHHLSDDLLARPGEQDLTAHVHFTTLQRAGESAGLKTGALVSQSQFLTGITARTWAAPESFGEWTAPRRRQFQTLTHPEHLGRAFRVLVQSR